MILRSDLDTYLRYWIVCFELGLVFRGEAHLKVKYPNEAVDVREGPHYFLLTNLSSFGMKYDDGTDNNCLGQKCHLC